MKLKTYNQKQEAVYIEVDFLSFMKFYFAGYAFITLVAIFIMCVFVIIGMVLG